MQAESQNPSCPAGSRQLDYHDYPWLVVMSARSQSELCLDFCFSTIWIFEVFLVGSRIACFVLWTCASCCSSGAFAQLSPPSDCRSKFGSQQRLYIRCCGTSCKHPIARPLRPAPAFRYISCRLKEVGVAILYTIQMSFLHVTRRAAKPMIYSSLLVVDGVALVGISACV